MKTRKFIYPLLMLVMVFIAGSVFSQDRPFRKERKFLRNSEDMPRCRFDNDAFIPDLTDDQKDKIKDIQLAVMKKIQADENKIGEKEARLNTLTSAENIDFKETDVVIDDIHVLKARIQKEQLRARQKIREILTDEQKLSFDRYPMTCPFRDDRPRRPNCPNR